MKHIRGSFVFVLLVYFWYTRSIWYTRPPEDEFRSERLQEVRIDNLGNISCQPRDKIYYDKIPKTGSSTTTNILLR